MVVVFGMERMTFAILRALRSQGADVHCIVNGWENHRVVPLVEAIGATWSIGRYRGTLTRNPRAPLAVARMVWDVLLTSAGLLRDAVRFRATHIFVPEHSTLIRNAPALLLLRAFGRKVVLRVPVAPAGGRFYEFLWGTMVPPLVSIVVANSQFTASRCRERGVPAPKLQTIVNRLPDRDPSSNADAELGRLAASRRTLLCVGQIQPFKGTHLAVAAALRLLADGEDLQLIVCGRKPTWPPEFVDYVERMESDVAAAGQGERVRFVGNVDDVLGVMKESFLLVAPIVGEEAFGLVFLEAKSVGLPVVAFARGAVPELVTHEDTGYLCDEADVEELLRGIRYFLHDETKWSAARRASLEAFERTKDTYSEATFSKHWTRVFGARVQS